MTWACLRPSFSLSLTYTSFTCIGHFYVADVVYQRAYGSAQTLAIAIAPPTTFKLIRTVRKQLYNRVIRIRMLIKKCDLAKLIYKVDDRVGYDDVLGRPFAEQRLRQLGRKHHVKVVDKKGASCWTPALGSIPGEFLI